MSTTTQSTNSDTAQRKVAQQGADILATPLTVAQRLLPTSPLPLALGTGARPGNTLSRAFCRSGWASATGLTATSAQLEQPLPHRENDPPMIEIMSQFAQWAVPAGRMSRVPWNFGGGPLIVRPR